MGPMLKPRKLRSLIARESVVCAAGPLNFTPHYSPGGPLRTIAKTYEVLVVEEYRRVTPVNRERLEPNAAGS